MLSEHGECKMTLLTAWESNTRLVGLYVATGCIINEQAQSVLLVGPWGQGKSEMIRRFASIPSIRMMTDMTQFGIRAICDEDGDSRVRHIAITEMDRLFSRDRATRGSALGLLTNLMTGDVGEEYIGIHKFDFRHRQFGVIAAMTTGQFQENRNEMARSGMLSRFQVIFIDRTEDERLRVRTNILRRDNTDLSPIKWKQLFHRAEVLYDSSLAEEMHEWLENTPGMPADERFTSRFIVLLKAAAWLNGRTLATHKDFETLKLFAPYFAGHRFVQMDWPFNQPKER